MKILKSSAKRIPAFILLMFILTFHAEKANAQKRISLGIHADPMAGWFTSDNKDVVNKGTRPCLNFGLMFNRYFTENYAFSTGLNLITSGGKLAYNDTITMALNNPATIPPGNEVIYNIKYLSIPLGLKLQSNQIGYLTFFTDLGVDPKFVLGGKAEIPEMGIEKENASAELKDFNMGYHVTAGIEYSLGGTTAIELGITFDSNFIDITEDTDGQPIDKILHKMLGIRLGINF
jgi:hypothetical protein